MATWRPATPDDLLHSSDAQALLPSSFSFIAADAGRIPSRSRSRQPGPSRSRRPIRRPRASRAPSRASPSGRPRRSPGTLRRRSSTARRWVHAQLDASANVPGTFTYAPAAGSILDAGSDQTLSVTFTPEDATYYTPPPRPPRSPSPRPRRPFTLTSSRRLGRIRTSRSASPQPWAAVAGTPSGTVTFYDGTTPLATVPVDGSGTATFTTSALSAGSHSITATYSGDADFHGRVRSAAILRDSRPDRHRSGLGPEPGLSRRETESVAMSGPPDGGDHAVGPGGGVPTGEVTFELVKKTKEEGEGDNARDGGRQRRRGDGDAQGSTKS